MTSRCRSRVRHRHVSRVCFDRAMRRLDSHRRTTTEVDLTDWNPLRAELGLAIRRLRFERLWTQTDLARRAAVNQTVVSRVERGRDVKLRLATLLRVLEALGVDQISLDSDREAGIAGFMRRDERMAHRERRALDAVARMPRRAKRPDRC